MKAENRKSQQANQNVSVIPGRPAVYRGQNPESVWSCLPTDSGFRALRGPGMTN
jgi:hypothetical protein